MAGFMQELQQLDKVGYAKQGALVVDIDQVRPRVPPAVKSKE